MRKIELMELLESRKSSTTDELINKHLPKLTKEYILARIDDISPNIEATEKAKIYNRIRVYKNRIEHGERKGKTLNYVFNFLGYKMATAVWQTEESNNKIKS